MEAFCGFRLWLSAFCGFRLGSILKVFLGVLFFDPVLFYQERVSGVKSLTILRSVLWFSAGVRFEGFFGALFFVTFLFLTGTGDISLKDPKFRSQMFDVLRSVLWLSAGVRFEGLFGGHFSVTCLFITGTGDISPKDPFEREKSPKKMRLTKIWATFPASPEYARNGGHFLKDPFEGEKFPQKMRFTKTAPSKSSETDNFFRN